MNDKETMKLALEALTYIYTETTADEDELIDQAITAIKAALAQPEPVAKYIGECSDGSLVHLYDDVKKGAYFYTTPPQRKPLTDEAIYAMCDDFHNWSEWDGGEYQRLWLNLCRAIEAAHDIKE